MHSKYVEVDGEKWTIHHNSDWSGNATVIRPNSERVELPGRVLLALSEEASKDKITRYLISALEQYE